MVATGMVNINAVEAQQQHILNYNSDQNLLEKRPVTSGNT